MSHHLPLVPPICCNDEGAVEPSKSSPLVKVADKGTIPPGGRLNIRIEGRYVVVYRMKDGTLTCLDSICFHAGGPLGIGDIEEVNGRECMICPWHYYKIDVQSGEKYYQSISVKDGQMVPGAWVSNGFRQRIHHVEEKGDGIYVKLSTGPQLESDNYAYNDKCGERVCGVPLMKGDKGIQDGGGDGHFPGKPLKPSGHVLKKIRDQTTQPH